MRGTCYCVMFVGSCHDMGESRHTCIDMTWFVNSVEQMRGTCYCVMFVGSCHDMGESCHTCIDMTWFVNSVEQMRGTGCDDCLYYCSLVIANYRDCIGHIYCIL